MTDNKQCIKCGSSNVADILYGMPTPSAMKQATVEAVVFGGYIISMNSPQFHCQNCEYRWAEYLVGGDK